MKKLKDLTKKERSILEAWITRNGACKLDYKNNDVLLGDGGLFSIEKENYKAHKITGYKKQPDGSVQVIFSKKRIVPSEHYWAQLWVRELDETINYLIRLKKILNKQGISTTPNKK